MNRFLAKLDRLLGNLNSFALRSRFLYWLALSLELKRGCSPPVRSMYKIIPVAKMSTDLEYSFLKATSGAINMRVPHC